MSGSVLDAITFERRGIPAAVIGVKKLAMTTGRGMAKIQGVPDFPIAIIDHPAGIIDQVREPEQIKALAEQAVPQVEDILLGR